MAGSLLTCGSYHPAGDVVKRFGHPDDGSRIGEDGFGMRARGVDIDHDAFELFGAHHAACAVVDRTRAGDRVGSAFDVLVGGHKRPGGGVVGGLAYHLRIVLVHPVAVFCVAMTPRLTNR